MDHPSPLRPNTEKKNTNICIPPAIIRSHTKWTNWISQPYHTCVCEAKTVRCWLASKPSKSVIYSWLGCHRFFSRAWFNQNHWKRGKQRGFQATYSHTGNNCLQAVSKHMNTKIYPKLFFHKTTCLLKNELLIMNRFSYKYCVLQPLSMWSPNRDVAPVQ